MKHTMIEKILLAHGEQKDLKPGDIVDVAIDARVARDFGGANVLHNLEGRALGLQDPAKTYFTFDCNPGGSDQKYAENQQRCRLYARKNGVRVFDIDSGIGTHLAIEEKLVLPGGTFVSTDSHANILGAIGAFGQGMGDQDIAAAWARGKVWFKVPPTVRVIPKGRLGPDVFAKDVVLAMLRRFGANGLLGCAVEIAGEHLDEMTLSDRITVSSMGTEMGAIIVLFPPDNEILEKFRGAAPFTPVFADEGAAYEAEYVLDLEGLEPLLSRPGHPEDVVEVKQARGVKIDSVVIGSCTNGSYEDMKIAAGILRGRRVAPGVVLKIVPATSRVWDRCLNEGLIEVFRKSGALVGNAGCAGCAAGQIGQNGPGEVTVSTGNRNFPGKQGGGHVYLASPATAAASAIAGFITTASEIPEKPAVFAPSKIEVRTASPASAPISAPLRIRGRAWVIERDNIDTDMIFHNRHLAIVDIREMGKHAFGNLKGWEDFSSRVKPGDIVFAGKNFGCGSSRQQAVDCFQALGVGALIAESFGAIYERNAINAAFPILTLAQSLAECGIRNLDVVELDLLTGEVARIEDRSGFRVHPFFPAQLEIYQRGGLLAK